MNDQQHAFWLAYIRHLADLMRLKDWDIQLSRAEPDSPTADAANFLHYGQLACEIHLPKKFFAESPEAQRHFLTHELIHCHSEILSEHIRLYIDSNGHQDAYITSVWLRNEEVMVDSLARVIAPFLPLPIKYSEYAEFGDKHITSELRPVISAGYNGSIHESIDRMARVPTNGAVR